MNNRIRAGVIGLGILGGQHARYLNEREDVDLVAVCDLREDVAAQTANELGAVGFTDLREMLSGHSLDLVTVATPDPMHRAPSVAAIEAGVPNIIQEKPMATTMEDARSIADAVDKSGARFFMNFANRASEMDIATRYIIQEGLLGRVVYGESRLDDNISVPTQMWGDRSREFAGGSSTAHFLLSHVVDLLRFYFSPAEVIEVYAISQEEVLGYTPDVYDAFLTFDSGLKVRVKAEWIKHIDGLVEFYTSFSGSEGTIIYNKRPSFAAEEGWRANLSSKVSPEDLLRHQQALSTKGVNVSSLRHCPEPSTGDLSAGGGKQVHSLEHRGQSHGGTMAIVGPIIAAIQEGTDEPDCWKGNGPLPNHLDGLKQTEIVDAIVRSSRENRVIVVRDA